jgi:hypothetical protein
MASVAERPELICVIKAEALENLQATLLPTSTDCFDAGVMTSAAVRSSTTSATSTRCSGSGNRTPLDAAPVVAGCVSAPVSPQRAAGLEDGTTGRLR